MTLIKGYLGAKGGSGVYQAIINLIPPHDTYIELFLGTGVVMKKKAPAQRSIGVDSNKQVIDNFDYAAAELHHADAFQFLDNFDFSDCGRTVIYCDPPYVHATRSSLARYANELTDDDHRELLRRLAELPCHIILSGYRGELYTASEAIVDWWNVDFQAMSRGGVRTETVWCNFRPGDIHYHTYAGINFTERQRIKRKAKRWAKNFAALPPGERQAVLAAILETAGDE